MRIEKDQKRMMAILGAMFVGFAAFFAIPQYLHEQELRKLIAGVTESTGVENVDLRRLAPLMKEVQGLSQELESQTRFVPEEAHLADLLLTLSSELSAREARDAETQTLPVVVGARYSLIPVTLRFKGSFASAFHFLNTIESSRRLTWVTKLEMTRPTEDSPQDVSVMMELCSFYSPTEESHP